MSGIKLILFGMMFILIGGFILVDTSRDWSQVVPIFFLKKKI